MSVHMDQSNVATFQPLKSILGVVGIITTAFTIFSNLKGVIEFSNFVRRLTDQWQEMIANVVNFLLNYIDIELDVTDAVLLFAILSCSIVALSAQSFEKTEWSKVFRISGWFMAAVFSALYFTFVVAAGKTADPRMEDQAHQYFLVSFFLSLLFAVPVFLQKEAVRNKVLTTIGILCILSALILYIVLYVVLENQGEGVFFEGISYGIAAFTALIVVFVYYVSSPVVVSSRSMSIGFLILALLGINYFSRIVEQTGVNL